MTPYKWKIKDREVGTFNNWIKEFKKIKNSHEWSGGYNPTHCIKCGINYEEFMNVIDWNNYLTCDEVIIRGII